MSADSVTLTRVAHRPELAYRPSGYTACGSHGRTVLRLRLGPPHRFGVPVSEWRQALQTLVGDCLQIAGGDLRLTAEPVAADMPTLRVCSVSDSTVFVPPFIQQT